MSNPNCYFCKFKGELKDGNIICKAIGGNMAKDVFNSVLCKNRYEAKLFCCEAD